VEDLEAAIEAFLTAWNKDPKPFVWTATVESITEKLTRCRRTLPWKAYSQAAPVHGPGKGRNRCPVISWTLALASVVSLKCLNLWLQL
jgi:hypothetical protein